MNHSSCRDRRRATAPPRLPRRARNARRLSAAAAVAAVLLVGCDTGTSKASPHSSAPGVSLAPSATPSHSRSTFAPALTTAATACTNSSKLAGLVEPSAGHADHRRPGVGDLGVRCHVRGERRCGRCAAVRQQGAVHLGSRLTTLKSHVPGHLGLLVMTDEAGGGIQRMANLVGSLPWPAYMGGTGPRPRSSRTSRRSPRRWRQPRRTWTSRRSSTSTAGTWPPAIPTPTDGGPSVATPRCSKAGVAYMNGLRAWAE